MIVMKKNDFINMSNQRGYKIDDVMLCVKYQHPNENWAIDETHESYPRPKNMSHEEFLNTIREKLHNQNQQIVSQQPQTEEGAGTELKKILKMIGITSTPNCSCNAKAKLMNQNGIQWCKDNIDTIVGWLKEEATKRNLPFFTYGAKKLVKLAISRAENAKTS